MRSNTKLIALALLSTTVLSGCSSIGSLLESDDDYRAQDRQIAKELEIPKNLFNPVQAKAQLPAALEQVEIQRQQMAQSQTIPQFQAEGVAIKSNLSERWLEISNADAATVWDGLKRFFVSSGFSIEQERKDIGIMKTNFQKREAIVPQSEMGPLTRMFNSWRPEMADGVLDKFIVRVENADAQTLKVYFNHSMMTNSDMTVVTGEEGEARGNWTLRPYSPVMESEVLYQAMVFFGSSTERAMAQLQTSENRVEVVDGDEFSGVRFKAGIGQSWTYVQAMVYRAGWDVSNVDTDRNTLWVKVPENLRGEESIISKLAFWRDDVSTKLPPVVKLILSSDDKQSSTLSASVDEGQTPLTPEQRKYIFDSLGLLAN